MKDKVDESVVWDALDKAFKGVWHAQRHEDAASLGIPDVSFGAHGVDGWLELKSLTQPKRAATPVRIPHAARVSQQTLWLRRRRRRGSGACWFFIRIGTTYYLMSPEHDLVNGGLTVGDYLTLAAWVGTTPDARLLEVMVSGGAS